MYRSEKRPVRLRVIDSRYGTIANGTVPVRRRLIAAAVRRLDADSVVYTPVGIYWCVCVSAR